jgi:hypothetical protein
MTALAFDTLRFTRKLESSGVPREQAMGITEAFAEASGEQETHIATKGDIARIENRLNLIDARFEQLELRMTVKFGAMLLAAGGLICAVIIFAIRLMLKGL